MYFERKFGRQPISKLLFLILSLFIAELAFAWGIYRFDLDVELRYVVVLLIVWGMGIYNLLAFFTGYAVLTIGGTDVNYGDRLMGLFYAGFFLLITSVGVSKAL